jgi:3-oxoacyl-[acyl-carrier protein] reductase
VLESESFGENTSEYDSKFQKGVNHIMRLKDRVALITGGAAGIGKATAQRFIEEGAKVVICDVNTEAGAAAVAELGPNAAFYQVNVADRQAVQEWVGGVVEEYGRVDILVNNAGVLRDNMLVKVKDGELVKQMPEADFDLVIAVNLKGVFNCTQAVAPYMIKQGGGVILNASSIVGLDGNFGQTNYVATKAGVIGMTKVWAREFGRYKIRVNAVAPGFIATEMVQQMPEKVLESMVARVPLGRLGKPRDIADAYLFLASDEASFVSGAVLRVDGAIVVGT